MENSESDIKFLWQVIDEDDDFEFPDYHGEKMTIQDCWIAFEKKEVQDTVRSLLKKMNITVVELEENYGKTKFCGVNLLSPCTESNVTLAHKRYVEQYPYMFTPMEPDEQVAHFKKHCEQIETLNLPNSLTQWGDGCFSACYALKNLRLPDSLQVLSARAFHACTSLTHIEIPEGVTRIGTDCFVADSALVSVKLPSTVEILDRGVFFLCRQLPEITLPATLKSIGDYAFYECDNLAQITCLAAIPPSVLDCFSKEDIVLKVPSESLENYRKHPVWGRLIVQEL